MTRRTKDSEPGGKRYRQVAEALLEDIRSGRRSVGETIPGELELVSSFGVSRHTVREALRRLEDLGLIGRRQGVGTVVLAREPTASYVQAVRSPAALLQYPAGTRLAVQGFETVRAGRALSKLIGCRAGSQWLLVSCIRRFDDARPPLCWTDLYLPPEYEPVIPKIGHRAGFVYELVEQTFGQPVAGIDVSIMARAVSPRVSAALQVEAGTPSLAVVRRYLDPARRTLLASVSDHPGDRFTYSLTLERGWQAGGDAVWSSR